VTDAGDERLLAEIRSGRREACAALIHAHYQGVYRFLLHLTRDVALAEDLTQDTFATAWEKIGSFAGRSSLRTWLYRIAHSKLVDVRRRSRRGAEIHDQVGRSTASTESPGPLDAIIASDQERHLYEQLQRLEPEDRTVLVLHYLQGLSYRDLAGVVDEPVNTVKWRVREALEQLRALFAEEAHHREHEPIE
jgi:RNA polymerase sigma-70 factor (ECF subfamily)